MSSHAGGIFVANYDKLRPSAKDMIGNVLNAVSETDNATLSDVVHDGAFDYTCKGEYVNGANNYTCGLQRIQLAGTFRGAECSKLKPTSFDDETFWDWFFFKSDSGLSDDFLNITLPCVSAFGSLDAFLLIKKMKEMNLNDAFINVTVPVNGSQTGLFNPTSLGSLTSVADISDNCSLSVMVQVGSPGCDEDIISIDTVLKGDDDKPTPDAVAQYELEKFGFEFSKTAKLWHRANVTGCELGCCDDCFQWFCPADDGSPPQFACKKYTYDCANPHQISKYNTSSEQVCGERPKQDCLDFDVSNSACSVDRIRC
jgi:hypothetical protein